MSWSSPLAHFQQDPQGAASNDELHRNRQPSLRLILRIYSATETTPVGNRERERESRVIRKEVNSSVFASVVISTVVISVQFSAHHVHWRLCDRSVRIAHKQQFERVFLVFCRVHSQVLKMEVAVLVLKHCHLRKVLQRLRLM
jgi:hypothetical protein